MYNIYYIYRNMSSNVNTFSTRNTQHANIYSMHTYNPIKSYKGDLSLT